MSHAPKLLFQPNVHDLKTWSGFFWQVQRGVKPFELRKNDREYQAGDILILRDYDQEAQCYTGHVLVAVVTCVIDDATFLQPGYVALGIQALG